MLQYLDEAQAILDTNSVDNYANEAIYHILQVLEGASTNFKNYNLTGLTNLLKGNIQFNQLVKVLCAKYSVFSSTPPEFILALTVMSSMYIVIQENRIKNQLEEPVVNTPIVASKI